MPAAVMECPDFSEFQVIITFPVIYHTKNKCRRNNLTYLTNVKTTKATIIIKIHVVYLRKL